MHQRCITNPRTRTTLSQRVPSTPKLIPTPTTTTATTAVMSSLRICMYHVSVNQDGSTRYVQQLQSESPVTPELRETQAPATEAGSATETRAPEAGVTSSTHDSTMEELLWECINAFHILSRSAEAENSPGDTPFENGLRWAKVDFASISPPTSSSTTPVVSFAPVDTGDALPARHEQSSVRSRAPSPYPGSRQFCEADPSRVSRFVEATKSCYRACSRGLLTLRPGKGLNYDCKSLEERVWW